MSEVKLAIELYKSPEKLDESLLKLAKKELNEKDAKQVAADIEYIRNWLVKQPHIKSKLDDQFILCFLRSTKFSYTKCQEKIERFWATRTTHPELFHGRNFGDDSLMMEIAELGFSVSLPNYDSKGRRLVITVKKIVLAITCYY